jgi:hypothetical protein
LPPARSQSALLVMLSEDGVVDEPPREPGAEVPGFVDPPVLPGVLGEGDGVLLPPLPGVLPPMPPLTDDPLPDPDVPPPVCASANAGASPRAMIKPQDMENAETPDPSSVKHYWRELHAVKN